MVEKDQKNVLKFMKIIWNSNFSVDTHLPSFVYVTSVAALGPRELRSCDRAYMAHRAENTSSGSLQEKLANLCTNLSTVLGPYSAEIQCYTLRALLLLKLHFNLDLIRLR